MNLQTGIYLAQSSTEREAVLRLRYQVYVEELGRYRSIADHKNQLFVEDIDENSRLYYAVEDGQIVGSMRNTWGGDASFTERHIEQYSMQPFLDEVPVEEIIIGERFLVTKEFRGTDLLFKIFCTYLKFCNDHRVQLIFGDCEPHLLNLYLNLGFRTYSKTNINNPEAGYLIPLIMIPEDLNYMRALKSPLLEVLKDFGVSEKTPKCVSRLVNDGGAVVSQTMAARQEYWSQTFSALNHLENNKIGPFDDLSDEDIETCLKKSNTITCEKNDCIVKKGNTAQNIYIVLSGVLEVRDEDDTIATLSVGDVFGEMAFLLGIPRTMDVLASTDDVKILCLSESQIKKITESHPTIAAKLLLNISKMLCVRLLRMVK